MEQLEKCPKNRARNKNFLTGSEWAKRSSLSFSQMQCVATDNLFEFSISL